MRMQKFLEIRNRNAEMSRKQKCLENRNENAECRNFLKIRPE